jgi:hypothetical protein
MTTTATLHPVLATIVSAQRSAPTVISEVIHIYNGVDIITTDGHQRRCLYSTVAKFRGEDAAVRAAMFFLNGGLEGKSFSFVSAAGWSCDEWFVALIAN